MAVLFIGALHPVNALLIFWTATALAQATARPARRNFN
jgi:hypothetical protein